MIVFAAIVPHSPLLLPSIGKEQTEKFSLTLKAMQVLEQDLYAAKPDTIVLMSPHGPMYPDAFSAHAAPSYRGTLKEFGDHATMIERKGDALILDRVHRHMREADIPFTLTSQQELDYGHTIPLTLLTPHLPSIRLLPLSLSHLDGRAHFTFGNELKSVLHNETRRIALIASADLSHHVNPASVHGETAEGKKFDRAMREAVADRHIPDVLALEPSLLEKAGQCGYLPIVTLLGALEHMNCQPEELCYEAPFGVGHMVVRFLFA
jgi:aromatic ring-opening dioxygenase LigB subunit